MLAPLLKIWCKAKTLWGEELEMRRPMFTALLLGLSAPAWAAQPAAAPPPVAPPSAETPDPARLAAAGRLVDMMLPPGSMGQIMSDLMPDLDMIMSLTAEQVGVDTTGMSAEQRARAVEELGSRRDPHFRERMRLGMEAMQRVMGEIFTEMEPDFRRVMVTMFARRFTAPELGEMIAFFGTGTGRRYAEMAFTMGHDPAWMEMMTLLTSRMAAVAPRIEQAVRAATAHLDPPPRI